MYFIILIGVEGIISSAKINEGSKSTYSNFLISIKDLEEIKAISNYGTANMLRIVFEKDRTKLDKQIELTANLSKKIDKLEKAYNIIFIIINKVFNFINIENLVYIF